MDIRFNTEAGILNVRCGAVIRRGDEVLIELPRDDRNSVLPGGRIHVGERSDTAILREMKEEMGIFGDAERLEPITVLENIFSFKDKVFHELYFLYGYWATEAEMETMESLGANLDNANTFFKFVPVKDVEKYDLLPKSLYPILGV